MREVNFEVDSKHESRPNTCRIDEELFSEGESSWRIFRIMAELIDGFEILRKHELSATIYGSARCKPGDKRYKEAEELAGKLARAGFAIITGGGPGIMEAGNKGAKEAGGESIGLNIELPNEQGLNEYTTNSEGFHYFFTRRVMLAYASEVYIYFPGGYGTLDELFEILTLVQTKKIKRIPIVLYGKSYWEPLIKWLKAGLLEKHQTISKEDLDLFYIVDSTNEAYELIIKNVPKCSALQA
ncbi:MAG: TIGR00730 family Rossman fold protein [Parcubacteria group bacterium]|nr:TIGR00730 family Rossman fold protein [Parcubacteria group bacterium]